MSAPTLGGLLGQLARQVLDQLSTGATRPAEGNRPAPSHPPEAGTPGIDGLLPPRVGPGTRTFVNDRLGGLERGGVFAAYDVGGHEVRVLVRRAGSAGEAAAMVAGAPDGPGRAAWADDRTWYSASGGTVQGDEDPAFGPGDVEAFEQFVAAWRAGGAR